MYVTCKCFVLQLYVFVHHVAVLNVVFCMTCSLLMLVKDARGVLQSGIMTVLYVAMSVSFCLTHPVAVSYFII